MTGDQAVYLMNKFKRESSIDNNARTTAADSVTIGEPTILAKQSDWPKPTGFPIALIVQIILAIISYLITKSSTRADKEHLAGLAAKLGGKVEIE